MFRVHLGSFLLLLCLGIGYSANITSRIYFNVDHTTGFRSCIRLTNAKRQVGCTSPNGGADGVLHLVNSTHDLDWVMANGSHTPYIPLLTQKYFTMDNLVKFKQNSRISGAVLVMERSSADHPQPLSPDQICPNAGFGLYSDSSNCTWNPNGTNLLSQDFDYPIFSLFQGPNLAKILDCVQRYNFAGTGAPSYPLCAAKMNDFMHAVKDTFTCMTQGMYGPIFGGVTRCDPLSGNNVWGTLTARNGSSPYDQRDIILLVTRLDAKGFFYDLSPGADTATSGLISLLAAIDALGKVANNQTWAEKIVFAVFNGESYDYIGSSRMVWQMQQKTFPKELPFGNNILAPAVFNLSNIHTIIELDQVGLGEVSNSLFMHYDTNVDSTVPLRRRLKAQAANVSMVFSDGPGVLPPASSQMFLRDDSSIEVVVIADHDMEYSNKYYNSYLDDRENLNVTSNSTTSTTIVKLTNLATVVARTAAEIANASPEDIQAITASSSYVNDLAVCFTANFSCPLFKRSHSPKNDPPATVVNARNIGANNANQWLSTTVGHLLARSTGSVDSNLTTSAKCKADGGDTLNAYYFLRQEANSTSGQCVVAPVYLWLIKSPAFEDPVDYRSVNYSTWTESRWDPLNMQVYLKPSPESQHTALGVGIAMLVIFVLLTVQINRVSTELFAVPGAANALPDLQPSET